ncbi:MAG: recombinase RecT [Rhizobiales bacterium]|nr:recombinase RecT [Hyphomicrobiales bacterium]
MPPESATAAAAPAKPVHPVVALRGYFEDRVDTFRNALPPHIKPERFIASVMTAVQINPDLLACDRRSLFLACVRCAQDGLLPDGTEAAIVPFKDKAQYMPMYQGLLKKFRNSGQFKWVNAGLVFEGEEFEHWIDETGEHFKHIPSNDNPQAKVKRVYALATTKDGGSFIADLSMNDINKRRAMSRASRDDAPWKLWEHEMMKKTALRVLSKLVPKSSDLDAFIQRDEDEALGVDTRDAIADQRELASGNLLDHFAGTESAQGTSPADQAADSGAAASGTGANPEAQSVPTDQAPPGDSFAEQARQAVDPIEVARRRGREGFRSGKKRREAPEEYRQPGRGAEALAYTEGWDIEQAESRGGNP